MQKKILFLVAVLSVMALLLAACGGGAKEPAATQAPASGGESAAAPAGAGNADAGKKIFEQTVVGSNPGCVTCHSLEPDTVLVGPSLAGIATRAATREDGMSAEDYIRQSILEPDAYVVDGFTAGTMIGGWDKALTEQQLNDVIAYLMTLK
ncbi:MAG TPA: cytochrome c [Chloroflexi bacterium]|nr:cytochrome c [Chloroflexota bacterium]